MRARKTRLRRVGGDAEVGQGSAEATSRSPQHHKERDIRAECDAKLRLELNLIKNLNGPGPVGAAFERVCTAGYNRDELQKDLVMTSKLDLRRSTRMYIDKDAKQLEGLANQIADCARRLLKAESDFPLLTPVYPRLACDAFLLSAVADSLRVACQTPKLKRFVSLTATQWIPWLIDRVKERTGSPHFHEMATLIGAALKRPEFSEDELKMRFQRSRNRDAASTKP